MFFLKFLSNKKPKIYLFNTLSSKKELFEPIDSRSVKIYSCGPTVYTHPHIGNMRAYVFADVLHSTLKYAGYNIKHVINITDVGHLTDDGDDGEDKLERQAQKEKKTAKEIADEITEGFFADLSELNIDLKEYEFPRATGYIKEQIKMVETLEEKGYTYRTKDGIYFDTSLFKNYGKLGNLNLEGLKEGARIGKNSEKKNPTDFALWKFSEASDRRQQEWDSPWGRGFPGWHIECSAMSRAILGQQIDIHTGGIDHIPVHHNNEIAQSESVSGKRFVKYWMHVAFLNLEGEKMAKSIGNVETITSLKDKGIDPLAFKYFLYMTHYRKELNFKLEDIRGAQKAYDKLKRFANGQTGFVSGKYKKKFLSFVYDDLSLPEAVAVIWIMMKDDKLSDADKRATLREFEKVLKLGIFENKDDKIELSEELQKKLRAREETRANKDWELADKLRDEFESLGYRIIDEKDGQRVEKIK